MISNILTDDTRSIDVLTRNSQRRDVDRIEVTRVRVLQVVGVRPGVNWLMGWRSDLALEASKGDTAVEYSDRVGFGQNKSKVKIFI